jgi:polysaccharide pyruvyl transferase WcaK-like protein
MKIGILTYHHVINDGAVLQTLGHVYTLKDMYPDATIEVIDYRHKTTEFIEKRDVFKNILKLRKGTLAKIKKFYNFKKFVKSHLPLSNEMILTDDVSDAIKFINRQNYDFVIVGSDEVWKVLNKKYARQFPNIYWLPKELKAKRIASAASANGSNLKLIQEKDVRDKINEIVSGFKAIGVRDQLSFDLINSINKDLNLYQVPDPTFGIAFNADGVKEKLVKAGVDFKRERIALNLSTNIKEFERVSKQFYDYAKLNNIQLVGIGQYNKYCSVNLTDSLNSIEWATCYQYFDFCVTDRFHSTIFSLKNRTPFLVVETQRKYPTAYKGKVFDLLSKINKSNHFLFYDETVDYIEVYKKLTSEFDKESISAILEKLKSDFREHLKNAIEN